ncbi:MAG: helix-turn-helix transcriptional regulator [Bacteroidetes bacterium]|nr:helix-turn-helix transcriptional regulator [Bacteroidota bacterium]
MENSTSVQRLFFKYVKEGLPSHLSLVDEVAELLHISNDSAYRRIRGSKEISFDEIRTLCAHFRISLDQLFHLQSDNIIFWGKFINDTDFNFDDYVTDILRQLTYINSFTEREMLLMSKDIPIFHYFNFPELAAFKCFFWMKTILQYPLFSRQRFAVDDFIGPRIQTFNRIVGEYNRLPSLEIWDEDSIHATIRQIQYYKETKEFASVQEMEKVYECLHRTVDHIEAQAELGCKFSPGEHAKGAPLKFYINEFMLGDNTYLACINDKKLIFLNHSVLNTIRTKDACFTGDTYEHFRNIISKSTQISGVGEKERRRFFNTIREKIESSRKG